MFSQNKEEQVILNYFGDYKGTLLDAGANDGVTFSNSRQLLLNGWGGYLFEPSSVGIQLSELYRDNDHVTVIRAGLGPYTNHEIPFFESGAHVRGGKDVALVSSFHKNETKKWGSVDFYEDKATVIGFKEWFAGECTNKLDFITIDIEGMDWELLQAINLTDVGCKCLCIEWNSRPELLNLFTDYCTKHNMIEIHRNAENLIFAV